MPFARIVLYVASIGAIAVLGRSLLIGPVPSWVAWSAMAAYLALILCGVFFLRLQMFVDAVWRGPADARGVALTFDDGPDPKHTPQILDLLDEHDIKATFFVIGHKAEKHPELLRNILERGHAIGIHSYAHDRLFSLRSLGFIRRDIEKAISVVQNAVDIRPHLFRPPIGHSNPRLARVVDELELTVIGWSIRGLDGTAGASADGVERRVSSRLADGEIVLLHDAAERDTHTPVAIKALPGILEVMERRNLSGVTVEAFLS